MKTRSARRRSRRLSLEQLELRQLLATLPSGFTEAAVATGLSSATAMEFAPNGDLWVLEQAGAVKRFLPGSTTADVVGSLSGLGLSSSGERGVLGIAFDPAYATNKQVFIYYTATTLAIHNRIATFTVNDTDPSDYYFTGTSTAPNDAGSSGTPVQTVIFDLDNLSSATNHNGGAIHFGPDGKLYVAVGDNATGTNAQTLGNLHGKMLRLNSDGSIPTDNPFFGTAVNNRRAIWALGLRNPFTFAFQPGTGRMFINDVGQNTWEEINDGLAGSNYGWPGIEGNAGTAPGAGSFGTYRGPIYAYSHGGGTLQGFAITGGAFYNPATQQFPAEYAGDYFFADFVNDWINVIDLNTQNVTRFATGAQGAVDLRVASDGSLYYLARDSSAVMRVRTTASLAPTITQQPSASTTLPENSTFTLNVAATGSGTLSYQWQRFVGGAWSNITNTARIAGATSTQLTINALQTADAGPYRAIVTNAQGSATSSTAALSVTPNQQPSAAIAIDGGLTAGKFIAGQEIQFSGAASDPEDGALAPSQFTWRVDYITSIGSGSEVIRPFIADFSGTTSSSFTPANTGPYTLADVTYRITLRVQDAQGLARTVVQDVLPNVATLTIASSPAGLGVTVDGQPFTTPHVFSSVAGFLRPIAAPTSQSQGGATYQFFSWSDGDNPAHTIATPLADRTYTVNYAGINPGAAWQNPVDRFDIDGNDVVSPLDALLIIIDLNVNGVRQLSPGVDPPQPYYDASGDNAVSPLDAVLVINALNAGEEGERASAALSPHNSVAGEDDEEEWAMQALWRIWEEEK